MIEELKKEFTEKQIEVIEFDLEHKPRLTILHGAIRSAKTTTNIFLFLNHIFDFRNKKFIITGSSIASIKRNVLDDISRLFDIDTRLNQKNEFNINGNTIICFGADQADSYKSMKGFTAYGWLGNEVTDHHKDSIDQAFKRCSGKGARIFWDTNPSYPDHPVKANFIDKEPAYLADGRLAIKSWHFILDDNTKLSKEYIEAIKMTTTPGMLYNRDILGLWTGQDDVIGAFLTVPVWNCQYCVAFIDPSFSDKNGTDCTAVSIIGVGLTNLIFTGKKWAKAISDIQVRRELLDFLNIYTPIETILESQLADATIFFIDAFKQDEAIYEIKNQWRWKHQTVNKHERISSTVIAHKNELRMLEGTEQAYALDVARYKKGAEKEHTADCADSLAGAYEELSTSPLVAEAASLVMAMRR